MAGKVGQAKAVRAEVARDRLPGAVIPVEGNRSEVRF
jgi:hypothetical protein